MDGLSWLILSLSLASATISAWEIWFKRKDRDWAWKTACVGATFSVLVAILAFVSGMWTAEESRKSKLAIAGANASAADAKKDAAKANEGLAKANLDIEDRKKENLKLSLELQGERAARLVLEEAIAPRGIEQAKSTEVLRKFAGTKVILISLDEPEPKTAADQINALLETAGWKVIERKQQDRMNFTGVVVSIAESPADAEAAKQLDAAAKSLVSQLHNKSDIAAIYTTTGMKRPQGDGTVLVTVGDIPVKAGVLRRLQRQRERQPP